MRTRVPVTRTADFELRDPHVGTVPGVLLRPAWDPTPRVCQERDSLAIRTAEAPVVDHLGDALPEESGDSEAGGRAPWRLECGGSSLAFRETYAEAARGEHLALIDSQGLIEAARRDGDAAASPGLDIGSTVQLRKTP